MKKQDKAELVLAYWPEGRGVEVFGNGTDYNGSFDDSASFKLALRGILPDPDEYVSSYSEASAMGDLIFWVYVTPTSCSVDLRYSGIYSATLPEIELRAKVLKRLLQKAEKAGVRLDYSRRDTDIFALLCEVCAALGVTRSVVYRSGKRGRETMMAPLALRPMVEAINARCRQLGGWRQAANAA